MENTENEKLKIRFKFSSGEEFEAEGPREFIEQQRAFFLSLTGRKPQVIHNAPPTPRQRPTYPLNPPANTFAPAPTQAQTPPPAVPPQPAAPLATLWERLFKQEDGVLVFRRKSRLLTAPTAALVLLAAAKILRKEDEFSALHLSKALRKSGYAEGRLDRLLLSEMRAGSLTSVGSKRGRAYKLSGEGFARAAVLAEKIAQDL